MKVPVYTRRFWAKAQRCGQRGPERIHLLEHHLADVAACFEALIQLPAVSRRLARTAGWDDIDDVTAARLSVFAALHDIGKANIGFQAQIWKDEDFPEDRRKPGRAGHCRELAPVLRYDDKATAAWFFDTLEWWWDATEYWDDRNGETVCGLFVAALSHHGQPLPLDGPPAKNPRLWRRLEGLCPQECVSSIGRLVRQWFPAAFALDGPRLPAAPAFQHMFLGLCNLADWIGSNEAWFEYESEVRDEYIDIARARARTAINVIGMDLSRQREQIRPATWSDITTFFPHFEHANGIQQAAFHAPLAEQLIIIESETGSGKTEAALWRFARMFEAGLVDGMYFALPTRAAASQIFSRVTKFVKRMYSDSASPEPVLAVPGYLKAGEATGTHLQDYKVWWDDQVADGRRWAAESAKRYLTAQIAVGTVDQAMQAALQVKHSHLRAACLTRNLLVVDEVHASDEYMTEILSAVLERHISAGGYALLMSATLGAKARHTWLNLEGERLGGIPPMHDAITLPYPAVSSKSRLERTSGSGQNKTVHMRMEEEMSHFAWVAKEALQAAQAGAKVLVIRNTVDYAVRTQEALAAESGSDDRRLLFSVNEILTLHHGRFSAADRALLDQEIESRLGRGRESGGLVVVGTQTLEQSLDIDADLLITDLCPADVLLQRIGRLHRHGENNDSRPAGYSTPQCVALTPGSDLSSLMAEGSGRSANGLGPHGGVYRDLHILEATRRLIEKHSQWRIPAMNRELVEQATHPSALQAITEDLGEAWAEHNIRTKGRHIAEVQEAKSHIARWDKPFYCEESGNRKVCFPSDDQRIRTRLGDDRVEITLDPPPASPLDSSKSVDRLALSIRWVTDQEVPESVEPALSDSGGFEFRVGKRIFRYDCLGLRQG